MRQARLATARRRARPLFAVAATILVVGALTSRTQPEDWSERTEVPAGMEPVAASLLEVPDLQARLRHTTPGEVAAVLTVDRDPTRYSPARYRVDATDPKVARCMLRAATRTTASAEPGRWTLVVPLRREG